MINFGFCRQFCRFHFDSSGGSGFGSFDGGAAAGQFIVCGGLHFGEGFPESSSWFARK